MRSAGAGAAHWVSITGAASVPVIVVIGAVMAVVLVTAVSVCVVSLGGVATLRSSERSLPMVPVTEAMLLLPVTSLLVMVMEPFATLPLPLQRSNR